MTAPSPHRVIIVGGGFAGLSAARALRKAPVRVTLIDRRNFHLFQPLLYQVATGGLSPANIASPLRAILKRQKNVNVVMEEVVEFDVAGREVVLRDGVRIPYDSLIVAAGARYNYFGHPEWEQFAPPLKTVEDATTIRGRILTAFEEAEREADPALRKAWLTFVIIGAGPTGVELAGALAEISRHTLAREFRHVNPADATILLVEAGPRVLAAYPQSLIDKAQRTLQRIGVTVRTATKVTNVEPHQVTVDAGQGVEVIPARTILWTAGVQATPLAGLLARAADAETDRIGRIIVQPDLTIAGHPEIFVLGDMAHCKGKDGNPLPGIAPVANQQGTYAGKLIHKRLLGRTVGPFKYFDKGTMATIGRAAAVVDLGWLRIGGYLAWLMWLFIHLMYLVRFENRLLVFLQWAYNYFTFNRSARLITHPNDDR
ncbi:MAG: NAD(P)/FAD-dependent oxidoreductase [Planctomycetaceae bacterium]|nr:NAD(P)/FAD-dependent oxidoreductase [Planctomycetaceae bacterium]